MDISEIKQNLGRRVRVLNERLLLDGEYILTGCIIRKGERFGIFYECELSDPETRGVVITGMNDVFPVEPVPPDDKPPSRQRAHNESDMLDGCRNRLFITDNPDELPRLYSGALYHLREIYKYAAARLAAKKEATNENNT